MERIDNEFNITEMGAQNAQLRILNGRGEI